MAEWPLTDAYLLTIKHKTMAKSTKTPVSVEEKRKRRNALYHKRKAAKLAENESALKKTDKKTSNPEMVIVGNECRIPYKEVKVEAGCLVFTF